MQFIKIRNRKNNFFNFKSYMFKTLLGLPNILLFNKRICLDKKVHYKPKIFLSAMFISFQKKNK